MDGIADLNKKTVPCFCCGKELEFAVGWDYDTVKDNLKLQGHTLHFKYGVDKGLTFHTNGGWGSEVSDMDADIIFVICDECIIRNSERALCTDWYQHYNTPSEASGPYDIFNAREKFVKWNKECRENSEITAYFDKPPTK